MSRNSPIAILRRLIDEAFIGRVVNNGKKHPSGYYVKKLPSAEKEIIKDLKAEDTAKDRSDGAT